MRHCRDAVRAFGPRTHAAVCCTISLGQRRRFRCVCFMGDEMSKRIPISQAEAIETATRVLRIKMEMGALKLLDSLIDDMPENDPHFGEGQGAHSSRALDAQEHRSK